jgi:exo-1,4-beta-D-glucosaminidase
MAKRAAVLILLGTSGVWSAPIAALSADEARFQIEHGWAIQSSAKVHESGAVISTVRFEPKGWYPARVPTTVLAALVAEHVYPDPYHGTNLLSIPGAAPAGENFANRPMPADSPFRVSWWYRTEFHLPSGDSGKNLWLRFNGINYRANVWLNGVQIAQADTMAGMWRNFEFNVTQQARPGGENALAVEVFPPTPDSLSITWVDWNPMPPDKDMGIWREVFIETTGPVALRDPQVVTSLICPRLIRLI